MSFEDRMKLYREKYGSSTTQNDTTKPSRAGGSKTSGSKPRTDKKNFQKKNGTSDKPVKHPSAPKGTSLSHQEAAKQNQGASKPAKKGNAGILGLIQKLFGGKKGKK